MTFDNIWNWAAANAVLVVVFGGMALVFLITWITKATEKFGAYTWYVIVTVAIGGATIFQGHHLFFFVFILGMLTAFAEIIGKFPDEPIKSLKTPHALCYHVFNGLIAMLALYILELVEMPHTTELDQVKIVAVAGLGSMMVMRSKLFSVKVGNEEVSVGPDQIIKIFFDYMEDAIDRVRARSRIEFVKQTLGNLRFDRIHDYSTTMLLAAQALDEKKLVEVVGKFDKLVTGKPEDPQLKSYHLGFCLLNLMGENFVSRLFADAPPEWKIAADIPAKKSVIDTVTELFGKARDTTLSYFAYDTDMAGAKLRDVLGWHGMDDKDFNTVVNPRPAILKGYKLLFNAPDCDGLEAEGLPNVIESQNDEIEGVLYTLPEGHEEFLKRVRSDYLPMTLPVVADSKKIQALVYAAKTPREGLKPKPNVVQSLVEAAEANRLSQRYVEKLQRLVPPPPVPPTPIEIESLTQTASRMVKVRFPAGSTLPPSGANLFRLIRDVDVEMERDRVLDASALASGVEIGPFESGQTIDVQTEAGAGAGAVRGTIREITIS